jgi:hypothetical protein
VTRRRSSGWSRGTAAIRRLGAVLVKQTDEWLVGHTYVSAESVAAVRRPSAEIPSALSDSSAA